ncbi:MAG: hypothetical protein SFV15_21035 [Polyangiaceae bacterium]|nr:hypothetical protein [Polyangiaceae bacterium]
MLEARRVGESIARAKLRPSSRIDIVDAHVAFIARQTQSLVYTSDYDDIAAYGVPERLIRRV